MFPASWPSIQYQCDLASTRPVVVSVPGAANGQNHHHEWVTLSKFLGFFHSNILPLHYNMPILYSKVEKNDFEKFGKQLFRSGRISSVYIVGWLVVGWLLVGCHTFSKFVYFECCSVVMMVY